jgi:hypothetical protein
MVSHWLNPLRCCLDIQQAFFDYFLLFYASSRAMSAVIVLTFCLISSISPFFFLQSFCVFGFICLLDHPLRCVWFVM